MVVYIFSTLLSAVLAWMSVRIGRVKPDGISSGSKVTSRFFAVLSFLPLFLVSAIRYNVGTDYSGTYFIGFRITAAGGTFSGFEIGFTLLNRLVLLFTNDYAGLFILTSFLFCLFVYLAIFQQSPFPGLSILLLVATTSYFISLNVVRQCIAIAMFLYAIKFIKHREFWKYLIVILIASTIHTTALAYLPLYFICRLKIGPKIAIAATAGVMFAQALLKTWFVNIISLSKYAVYIDSQYDAGQFGIWVFLIGFAILLAGAFFYKKARDKEDYQIFFTIQTIAVLALACSAIIPVAYRLCWLFSFAQILFIPKISEQIKNRLLRNSFSFGVVLLYSVYTYITIVQKGYHEVLPYQTIFSR